MRLYLLVLLAPLGMSTMVTDNWKTSPYDQSTHDYPGDKLREAWPRLTRDFGGYPCPGVDWMVNMVTAHPDVLEEIVKAGIGLTGKPEKVTQYAARLQDVWYLLLRGDYAKAKEQGPALGVGGQIPAMFAQVPYTTFLALDQAEKQRLLEEVIDYTEQAGPLIKADIAVQLGNVCIRVCLAEELLVLVVPKCGYTNEIPRELNALLTRRPNQPFALALYSGYETGVICKVGRLVGKMTYGVSIDKIGQYFVRSFRQASDLPIGHYKYASALIYVYNDNEREKAIAQLKQAATIKPINVMEVLEAAHAKKLFADFEQNTAQR